MTAVHKPFVFGKRSKENLIGVNPNLVSVVTLALELSPVDFTVTNGLRTKERQLELVRLGKSRTLRSRHLTGHAIDVAAFVHGKISWDWAYYDQIAVAMKNAAKVLGITIEWGGDWESFKDGPHFQLSWKDYPNKPDATGGEQA